MAEDDFAGITGLHPQRSAFRLMLAPTLADGFNTVSPRLTPVSCWRMDDVRFGFDSSFVMPAARREIGLLRKLVHEHPNHPLAVFGHADPTGDDEYNKTLAGRRALAIYAMLVRRPDAWERLYGPAHAHGHDAWGTKHIQRMLGALTDGDGSPYYDGAADGIAGSRTVAATKAFQTDSGLPATGTMDATTRAKLFEAYMDFLCTDDDGSTLSLTAADFLARGADPDGKGDYQGCGEFNPVLVFSRDEDASFQQPAQHAARSEANVPNRRVVIYLFEPGTEVSPDAWPCPSVAQDSAGCRARFWSDAEPRRNPQDARRHYEDTRDTFACRFYDRLSRRSPCEGVAKVADLPLVWVGLGFDDATAPMTLIVRNAVGEDVRRVAQSSCRVTDQLTATAQEHDLTDLTDNQPYSLEVTLADRALAPRLVIRPAALRRAFKQGDMEAAADALSFDFSNLDAPPSADT